MNKQLVLLWVTSLLITFYLGYSVKLQPAEAKSSFNSSLLAERFTSNELLQQSKNINSLVLPPAAHIKANNNTDIQVSGVSLTDALAKVKSTLGNGMDIASIAKAYNLIDNFSEQELAQALIQIEGSANQPNTLSLLSLLLSKYAEQNPEASLSYIEEYITSNRSKLKLTNNVIASWAKDDVHAAYDWFVAQKQSKTSTKNNSTALEPLFAELTKQDFQSAIDQLMNVTTSSRDRYYAVAGMTQVFTTQEEFSHLMDSAYLIGGLRIT